MNNLPRDRVKIYFILLFTLANLHKQVQASQQHWINLHLLHEELTTWDPDQSISSNLTGIGGRQPLTSLPLCHELDGLTDGQIKLCLLFYDHMRPIVNGAKLGLSECRWQFRHNHWNCSVLPIKSLQSIATTPTPPFFTSPTPTLTTIPQSQSRVSRENKNGQGNKKRKPRNHRNATTFDNLNLARDFYSPDASPKSNRKKGRKNAILSDESNSNNFVVGLTTPSSSSFSPLKKGLQIHDLQPLIHHHQEKEEKSDWNSIFTRATKEAAFALAVFSAAVTESISRSCREGSISSCGCGKTPRPADLKDEWRWGGCGDNLQYGYKFAQSFVDIREQENASTDKKAKARALVSLHNNEAGRRAVLKKTKIACKCHGVSGSCALVTCWHQIPSFREIGDYLKLQYEKGTQVKLNRRGRLQVKKSGVPVPGPTDLVYIEASPNYCVQNETLGIYGTSGRMCNRTLSSPNSCKNLCCNRGHTSVVAKSGHRCNCKFLWCCQVICEECRSVQKYDVCK